MIGGDGQRRLRVPVPVAFLLLAGVDLLDAPKDVARGRRRHPVQVLLQMATAAPAAARLVGEIVALLRPEVLVSLTLAPGPGPAAGLQIGQYGLFPLIEALAVHVPAGGAQFVVAGHADRVPQVVQGDEHGVVVVGA